MDMVSSMISYSTLQLSMWMEVLKTDIHILNRVQSKSVPKTPYELWTGRVPSLNHLRVWGSPAEAKVFNTNIEKLDPKTVSCHLFGYPEKSKVFRFLLSRETYKVCGNETRCLPRGRKDEGEHGSSRNCPWSEAGVCAHSNDSWANFLTTWLHRQCKILWCQHLLLFHLWQQWIKMRNLFFRIL